MAHLVLTVKCLLAGNKHKQKRVRHRRGRRREGREEEQQQLN